MRYPTFFFFNDTATTEIYTLSLHDALPISRRPSRWTTRSRSACCSRQAAAVGCSQVSAATPASWIPPADRKSTRLNSSHLVISYAVFCLKKKIETSLHTHRRAVVHQPRAAV